MIPLDKPKKIHFIGIGGIGMSGVALILRELGHEVSGSDVKDNHLLGRLRKHGARIFIGHEASHLREDTDVVVYTSCIAKKNPEVRKARALRIPLVHRQKLLAALMERKRSIAITGAHGKSTTAALMGSCLLKLGLDPTVVVGAEVPDLGGNARLGKSNIMVIEADESDGSLVELEPYYAIITNIDKEHIDYYRTIEAIVETNRKFVERIQDSGCLFCLHGDKHIADIIKNSNKPYVTFGFSEGADVIASATQIRGFATTFRCTYKKRALGDFKINLVGNHNVLNALAVIAVALEMGIKPSRLKEVMAGYRGARRRFEVKGRHRNIFVIEDYAHHPTEIEAILRACRRLKRGRIISIFQPHRFSRTKFLAHEFGRAFTMTDELILADIYSAHERPIKGVSSRLIFEQTKKNGKGNVALLAKEDITDYVLPRVREGDTILVLGAGDIGEVSDEIAVRLKQKSY
jgi:UDP-N-acetylmuramate--alanine ligase